MDDAWLPTLMRASMPLMGNPCHEGVLASPSYDDPHPPQASVG